MIEISVVVPTYKRPGLLQSCLDSLAVQTTPVEEFEIVVVDDGSGDETPGFLQATAAGMPNLHPVLLPENRGPAHARNRGIEAARGSIVLFLDDDIVAPEDLVARHRSLHRRAGDSLLGFLGRVDWLPSLRVTRFMRWLDRSDLQFSYETWLREGPVDPPYAAFYTANLSVRRSLVVEAGGFDERFPYANYEDVELAYRLTQRGFRLEYRPEALAWHARAIDLPSFCRRMANEAESASLMRSAQSDFPINEYRGGRWLRRRYRLLLRAVGPVASAMGWHRPLERYFEASVAEACRAGRSRREHVQAVVPPPRSSG